jgi:kynurenine formamidase
MPLHAEFGLLNLFIYPCLTHIKLLSNGIGIIENLNSNLKKIRGRRMYLISLPLLLREIDGSPARTIAFEIL